MQAWVVVTIAAIFGASCFSSAKYEQAHQQRVDEINSRFDEERQEAEQRGQQLLASVDGFRKFLVEVQPGHAYSPADRIDHSEWFVKFQTVCNGLDAQSKASGNDAEIQRLVTDCWSKLYIQLYLPALTTRYYRSDAAAVTQMWLDSKGNSDLESLFAYSHNTAVLIEIQAQKADIQALIDRKVAEIERERASEVGSSEQQRDQEIEAAQAAHRANMAAIGSALSTLGQSMSQRTTQQSNSSSYALSPSAPITGSTAGNSCTSDLDCGYGSQCVKQMYSGTGFCATSVNKYDVQTFSPPNLNSIGPKTPISTDCKTITDCPVGFTCDTGSGVCLRHP